MAANNRIIAAVRPSRRIASGMGLCQGARVMTLDGELPVEYLCAGDRVVTRSGARTLRHVASRKLWDCPIVVRRGALGPGRPETDLYLAPGQAVHLRGWQQSFPCGSDARSVPVSRLFDGRRVHWGEAGGPGRVFSLEFDEPVVIYVQGVELMAEAVGVPAPAVGT